MLIPYILLTVSFDYPDILRATTGSILRKFHDGGGRLIFTWLAFALLGLPLLAAYILIGQKFENKIGILRLATTFGVVSAMTQIIGLLRWVFVVPVLAANYIKATLPAEQASIISSFETIHQFAGVLLGEHIGQLFTIIWTLLISITFLQRGIFNCWIHWWGIISALVYLMAQAELLSTVIPGMPFWEPAGFVGSSLWLIWLILLGSRFLKMKKDF